MGKLETVLLVIIWSTDMGRYDSCNFLDLVSGGLPLG